MYASLHSCVLDVTGARRENHRERCRPRHCYGPFHGIPCVPRRPHALGRHVRSHIYCQATGSLRLYGSQACGLLQAVRLSHTVCGCRMHPVQWRTTSRHAQIVGGQVISAVFARGCMAEPKTKNFTGTFSDCLIQVTWWECVHKSTVAVG